ncbi:deoxycytidylate deaminase-like [Vespa mandarinia]|uniref:deoxycytidylate deaminase-like n=1 Tax=Vespa mandarinia TaxID=7446 RepID=UPI0016122BBF|nr:deoxycytidylate deaminase-like [Vespa mandarinia]
MSVDTTLHNNKCQTNSIKCKRSTYMDWDEYFMAVAFLVAKRSKDPITRVGACIVDNDNKIVGVGYNGMPRGCSDDIFPWEKNSVNKLNEKRLYVCHAEVNAILNKNSNKLKKCRMYVGLFPCNECAKVIIQSGLKTIIYMSDKYSHKIKTIAAKRMFDAAKVMYIRYIPKNDKIVIDFNEINCFSNMKNLVSDVVETDCDVQNHNDNYCDVSTLSLENDKSSTSAEKIDETSEERKKIQLK